VAITKRVIILEKLSNSPLVFRYALWADVPAARQPFYAVQQANTVSAWKDAAPGDNTAIQSGAVTEIVDTINLTQAQTVADAQAALQAIWTAFQARINNFDPWQRYGTFMDTTNSWTAGGVA